ncbi:MAG TPA: type II secretion system protein [Blastocatellia bacterium]|jgi:prepilin-type N-terminal cleavage/methylation domain-containing protein|nr:type II secretion system protein [Blastocatellia bacterium]
MENPSEHCAAGEHSSQSGFTMIELTAAMVIFAIVLASIFGLLEVGRATRFRSMQGNEAIQDVRVGLNAMAVDVLNTGVDYPNAGPLLPGDWLVSHLLVSESAGRTSDNLTPVIAGYQLNSLTNTQSGSTVVTKTDQVTLISTDKFFNSGLPLNISSMTRANAWLTVAPTLDSKGNTVKTATQNAAVVNPGDLIFVTSGNSGNGVIALVTGRNSNLATNDSLVVAASDALGVNDLNSNPSNMVNAVYTDGSGTVNAATPAGARRIAMTTYYVSDDGTGLGTGVLMRRVYGGVDSSGRVQAYVDQPLAFDVTTFNIQYYLQGTTAPVASPAVTDFSSVRQITVSITVRSPSKDRVTGQPYTEPLTATMNTRNLGYEKN